MATQSGLQLRRLAELYGGELIGDGDILICGIRPLASATPGDISFLTNSRYRDQLTTTRASAVILAPTDRNLTDLPRLVVANPYACMAKVSTHFHPRSSPILGIHPQSSLAETASIGENVHIGAHAVIGDNVVIESGVVIAAGCVIGDRVRIGSNTYLHPNVTIYKDCILGHDVIVHSGVIIGADGFGIALEAGKWIKVPQVGTVRIGNWVEIGANTTIDRGAFDDTVIEDGVKLDNQIQIAHNVVVGAHTAIAACAGIAGSAMIGKHCMIGGAAMIVGHIEIADHTVVSAGTMVTKSITKSGTFSGMWPAMDQSAWNRQVVRLRHLDRLAEKVKALEDKLKAMEGKRP